jgi:hypothetical protein
MANTLRRRFYAAFWSGLRVVWPVLSGLLGLMAGLGGRLRSSSAGR